MKEMKISVVKHVLLLIVVLLSAVGFAIDFGATDCLKGFEKMIQYCNDYYYQNKLHYKFSTQTIENGIVGKKLTTELWLDGKRFKYTNEYMQVYQDLHTQVVILKTNRFILLRKVVGGNDTMLNVKLPSSMQIDSIKKIATNIRCESLPKGLSRITIDFPERVGKNKSPFKQTVYEYSASTGELKKGEYIYNTTQVTKKDIYEYIPLSEKFDDAILQGSADEMVYSDKKLRKEYTGYKVKDLRQIQSR